MKFAVTHRDGAARRGMLELAHGGVDTPAFMPVGTYGTVKAMSPEELRAIGAQLVLGNAFHLWLRPGLEVIAKHGGLHRFMGWDGPVLTDSGGFQVFSLGALRKISEEGVQFASPVNGDRLFLTPEESMRIQQVLDSDIAMVLDECTPFPATEAEASQSMALSMRWAARSKAAFRSSNALFGIVQGGLYPELRAAHSPEEIVEGMRHDITILVKQGSGPELSTFTITYQGKRPALVATVANELANSFIQWNNRSREMQVSGTKEFFSAELDEAKKNLQDQEEKLRQFKMTHLGEAPDQMAGNLQAISGLRTAVLANQDTLNRLDGERLLLSRLPEPVAMANATPVISERSRLYVASGAIRLAAFLQRQNHIVETGGPAVFRNRRDLGGMFGQGPVIGGGKMLGPDPVQRRGLERRGPLFE